MAKAEPGEGTVPTGSSRNQSSALSFLLVAYPAPYLRVGGKMTTGYRMFLVDRWIRGVQKGQEGYAHCGRGLGLGAGGHLPAWAPEGR